MKDRQPKQYEAFIKYGHYTSGGLKGEVARAHVGIKRGNQGDIDKTVYRHFETIRKHIGVRVPKPLFVWRTYIAEQRRNNKASELNNPRI